MEKTLNWDMDGTFVDLYGVEGWLPMLDACDPTPYVIAEALIDMYEMWCILEAFRAAGWTINIISWNSKSGDNSYRRRVRQAKVEWLEEMGVRDCFDHIHVIQYGKPKNYMAKGVLVDDNSEVRQRWENAGERMAINAADENFLDALWELLGDEE